MGKLWKLRQERALLEDRQKSLREKCDALLGEYCKYSELERQYIAEDKLDKAKKMRDLAESAKKELEEVKGQKSKDLDEVATASKVQTNDNVKHTNNSNTLLTAAGMLTGTALAGLGLKCAYDADVMGSLTHKGVLNTIKGWNPFTLLRRH